MIATLSNRNLHPGTNWPTLGPPLLERLAELSGRPVVAPPPLRPVDLAAWRRSLRAVQGADRVFWMQISARPSGRCGSPGTPGCCGGHADPPWSSTAGARRWTRSASWPWPSVSTRASWPCARLATS